MEDRPVTDRVCGDSASVPGTDASSMQETSATSSSCKVGVSAPGVDTAVICSKITEGSAARRRGVKSTSTPGVDDEASSVGGCKRPTNETLAYSPERIRRRLRQQKSVQGRARTKNKWSRAPQEEKTAQETQAAQAAVWDRDVTRDVCRVDIGHDVECRDVERLDTDPYWSPVPVNATGESSDECVGVDVASSHELDALREGPARWTHRTDMHPFGSRKDESDAEELRQLYAASTTENEDTLSAKTKKERFDGQIWDSLKASPFCEVLREHKDVLPDEIPEELPQDKGIQHEIDLVPGTKYSVKRQ
ncbi:hypothetical protein PC119_g25546 [Phytophthora cactorum]|uniref:Reverse transcriptase n=2 Tax=Phytophthora cactorum TaxID=29920 RepID=A0A8T1B3C6_9STRA|nr:hypothetical protein PC114_g25771 [Phytophthora cactorum]KAG2893957.1 hypothetical protein PC117_g23639 [Phytophthora cactorum]KAG2963313.1 hypothetical protein PC119_g25546 [Phytophthora cactorum]KAG3125129.1 hypothetical protein C6341_g25905 [Phytophthora cactorum]